jgi:hypothetical protein
MTNTEILKAIQEAVFVLGLPVKVSVRTRANYKGELDKEPSELFVTADAFGEIGFDPVKVARAVVVNWILDNKDRFADKKVVNLRGRGNNIFRYTYCDRYPEHIFFGLRIEKR